MRACFLGTRGARDTGGRREPGGGRDPGRTLQDPLGAGPFHRLPYREIVRRVRSVSNVRVVEDAASSTGYGLDGSTFARWDMTPRWSGAADEAR